MKSTLLVLVALGLFASGTQAQGTGWCRCGLFVSTHHTEWLVLELPNFDIDNCESHAQCMNECIQEMNSATHDMNLFSQADAENTVGQKICTNLTSYYVHYIHNSMVHGYYEMCGGPWEYTGLDSKQMLCCNKGQHTHCIE